MIARDAQGSPVDRPVLLMTFVASGVGFAGSAESTMVARGRPQRRQGDAFGMLCSVLIPAVVVGCVAAQVEVSLPAGLKRRGRHDARVAAEGDNRRSTRRARTSQE